MTEQVVSSGIMTSHDDDYSLLGIASAFIRWRRAIAMLSLLGAIINLKRQSPATAERTFVDGQWSEAKLALRQPEDGMREPARTAMKSTLGAFGGTVLGLLVAFMLERRVQARVASREHDQGLGSAAPFMSTSVARET